MERQITLIVWVGIITDGYGDFYVQTYRTEDEVRDWVHHHCIDNWDDEDDELPDDRDEALDKFFENSEENWFCYERNVTMPMKQIHDLIAKSFAGG